MKNKRFITGILLAMMLLLSVCAANAAGDMIELPAVSSPMGGVLRIEDVKAGTVVRVILPDGTKSDWFRFGPDSDYYDMCPADAGEYRVEACAVSALTVKNADAESPYEMYDLWTDVPADQIQGISQHVEQAAELSETAIDLSLGDVIFSSSMNDFFTFALSIEESELPQPTYMSQDGGKTWLMLSGIPEIINSDNTEYEILMGGDFCPDGSIVPGQMCDISIFTGSDWSF